MVPAAPRQRPLAPRPLDDGVRDRFVLQGRRVRGDNLNRLETPERMGEPGCEGDPASPGASPDTPTPV
jgi:hypothetical protein